MVVTEEKIDDVAKEFAKTSAFKLIGKPSDSKKARLTKLKKVLRTVFKKT